MARIISGIDGSRVIEQGPAYGPHPNPAHNTQILLTGIIHVLLENALEYYVCETCMKPFDKPRSAVAHMSSHTKRADHIPNRENVDLIKMVLRTIKRYEDCTDKYALVADELNKKHIKTFRGKAWTGANVQSVYGRYRNRYKVRAHKNTAPETCDEHRHSDDMNARTEGSVNRIPKLISWHDREKVDQSGNELTGLAVNILTKINEVITTINELTDTHNNITQTLITASITLERAHDEITQMKLNQDLDPEITKKIEIYEQLKHLIK